MRLIYLFFILNLANCSFKKNPVENQIIEGHEELYSSPSSIKLPDLEDHERHLMIVATNDVHGKYDSTSIEFKDNYSPDIRRINIGGKEITKQYFEIIRKKYSNTLFIDSGNIFNKKINDLKLIENYYKELNYDAITLGLKDFNTKLPTNLNSSIDQIKNFSSSDSIPLILSNLYELKTAKAIDWVGVKPYLLKEIGGIKVGILGIIPDDMSKLTPLNNRVGLYVDRMIESTLRQARMVRTLGADVVVVLTNQSLECGESLRQDGKLPLSKVNFEPNRSDVCDLSGDIGTFLRRLPYGLVDVIVLGRNGQKVANVINGVNVLSGFSHGKSFNSIELVVDTTTKRINPLKTQIHQPTLLCHEFFEKTKDCYTEDPTIDHTKRSEAIFYGELIQKSNSPNTVSDIYDIDVTKALKSMNADLILSSHNDESHLFEIQLDGKTLARILEIDFNLEEGNRWKPSPFKRKENNLYLEINNSPIDYNKSYKILTDIESIQTHRELSSYVNNEHSKSYQHISWMDFHDKSQDEINTILAAPKN